MEQNKETSRSAIIRKQIIQAYVFLRTNNNTIPDEVIDFMKEAALEKLTNLTIMEEENLTAQIVISRSRKK